MTAIRPVGPRPLPAVRERPRVAAPANIEEPVDEIQEVVREEPQREARPSESHELGERRQARTKREAVAYTYAKNSLRSGTFETKI
jgi:hypothetical protein